VAWKTASKERLKFDPAVADQELDVPEPLIEAEGEVAGRWRSPNPVDADLKVTRRDRLGGLLHEYAQAA
jgi:hypothetical protein